MTSERAELRQRTTACRSAKPLRRRQLTGADAIARALDAGEPVQLILAALPPRTPAAAALLVRARKLGVPVRSSSERARWRLSGSGLKPRSKGGAGRDSVPVSASGSGFKPRSEGGTGSGSRSGRSTGWSGSGSGSARSTGWSGRDSVPVSAPGTPAELLALVGSPPAASLDEVLGFAGAVWQLVGLRYPGNTGAAIRTAEVSGADAVVIDSDFEHGGRREALRASMRADHFMPVFWERALEVLPRARAAGRAITAIEDSGRAAPWQVDLTTPQLFVVGGERHGIPQPVLDACDRVLRIPMRGFIPSYNVQAAVAMVAGERLRQLETDST